MVDTGSRPDTSREAVEREWAGIWEWVQLGPVSRGDLDRARKQAFALLAERDEADKRADDNFADWLHAHTVRLQLVAALKHIHGNATGFSRWNKEGLKEALRDIRLTAARALFDPVERQPSACPAGSVCVDREKLQTLRNTADVLAPFVRQIKAHEPLGEDADIAIHGAYSNVLALIHRLDGATQGEGAK